MTAAKDALSRKLSQWAEGQLTLSEVRGYSEEELYAVAKTGYYFFHQGKTEEARTVFQGLYALKPNDGYFAKALGVVEYAAGNVQGALAAFDLAVRLNPQDAGALVGRAEIRMAEGQKALALEDLRRASTLGGPENSQVLKAYAILESASKKS